MREWLRRRLAPAPAETAPAETAPAETAPAETAPAFDPYHYCAGGWFACCEANLALQEADPSYCAHFADPRAKYAHGGAGAADGDGAPSAGRHTFTYRRWVWHDEVWFEELPRPSRLAPSACGLCYSCVSHRGRLACFFPQADGAYARWRAARAAEWLGRPLVAEKSCG